MTQREADDRGRDSAAVQEAAAAVVHGIYRAAKACLFHTDVNNDAVTGLTAAATATIAEYCQLAATPAVSIAFLGDAVFVNRHILKGSRDTHALATALRELLEPCGVTELTFQHHVSVASVATLAKLLADVQRDRGFAPYVTAGNIDGVTAGKAKFAATGAARQESPGTRASRTFAMSVMTVQTVLADVQQRKYELPRRIKRVAQKLVALADEDARLLVALAASGASINPASIAVASAILAVAMTKQLTTDRALLTNAAMTALLHDAGRIATLPAGENSRRTLNDDELDRVPARSVLALTAMGRMHAPARARTALLYEVWSQRRAHRLGPLYGGRRPPTVLSRIIGVARAFAELRAAGAGGGLSIDDAIQMLTSRATDGTEKALVKLFVGALGIYPAGTMVELNTGELGVVMATPAMPVDYVRPPVKILYDAHANLLEEPIDIDLAAPLGPGDAPRFIWRNIDADERQMKAMRSYVVAAQAAKRRVATDDAATYEDAYVSPRSPPGGVPSSSRSHQAVSARPPPAAREEPSVGPTHRPPEPYVRPVRKAPHEPTHPSASALAAVAAPRPPSARPTAEAAAYPSPQRPPPPNLAEPGRRPRVAVISRDDGEGPSSMQDEVFAPRSRRPAVPRSETETVRPVRPAAELEAAAPEIVPVSVNDAPTAPPPPSQEGEEAAAASAHDDLLAAFLADAPLDVPDLPDE